MVVITSVFANIVGMYGPAQGPMQASPDIVLMAVLVIFGMVDSLCIGCVAGVYEFRSKRRYKRMARERGIPNPIMPRVSLLKYELFAIVSVAIGVAIIYQASLVQSPMTMTIIIDVLWYWLILWIVVPPAVMIYATREQSRQMQEMMSSFPVPKKDDSLSQSSDDTIDYDERASHLNDLS